MHDHHEDHAVCRRGFLQSAGCFSITLALCGLGSAEARALPVLMTEGVQNGAERRYPIPPADSVNVDRAANVIVVRFQNHAYVFSLSCPHQNNAVKWVQKNMQFQCTKHDSHYQPDGVHVWGAPPETWIATSSTARLTTSSSTSIAGSNRTRIRPAGRRQPSRSDWRARRDAMTSDERRSPECQCANIGENSRRRMVRGAAVDQPNPTRS